MEPLKVSVSGVRGIVGKTFTPEVAISFAQAFGTFVGKGPVVVGRDTRTSGEMIEQAVIAGLLSVGCTPVCSGVSPTPSILYVTKRSGARGGIAITASHNPAPWNALKFVDRTGLFLDERQAEELFDVYHQRTFPTVIEEDLHEVEWEPQVTRRHFRKITTKVDADAIRDRSLKIAVDCCNGVGAKFSRPFLEALGVEVVAIHEEPNGQFARDPEPRPEHLKALCETVRREHCDAGFAQDPDGDRLALVDENGHPILEDLSAGLASLQVVQKHQKGPVVFNQSISKAVEERLQQEDVPVLLTQTGEINVCRTILDRDGVAGGESSGGVIFPAVHPCRDSFGGMALVLERLSQEDRPLSEMIAEFPTYYSVKAKIPVDSSKAADILRKVRQTYASENISLLDGVYVDFGDRWLQVRRSNTEPILRCIVEAPTQAEAEELSKTVIQLIKSGKGR